MSVTSAQLRQVAGELRSFATSLGASSAAASTNIGGLSTSIEAVAGTWSGPDPTRVNDGARAYVAEVDGAPGLIDEMEQTVRALAEYADAVAQDIAGWELRRAAVAERRRSGTPLLDDADSAWIAESRITELGNTWVYNAAWYALVLASNAAALRRCCDAVAMSAGHPQPPSSTAYHTMVAIFANAEGVALDVIDPTGRLEATVMTMIADLENDELGPFKFTVLEVMRQRNLDMQDLILTDNDLGSAEYGVALALWTEVNTRYNLGLSDGEMELLAHESVATALMLHAADDDLRGDPRHRPRATGHRQLRHRRPLERPQRDQHGVRWDRDLPGGGCLGWTCPRRWCRHLHRLDRRGSRADRMACGRRRGGHQRDQRRRRANQHQRLQNRTARGLVGVLHRRGWIRGRRRPERCVATSTSRRTAHTDSTASSVPKGASRRLRRAPAARRFWFGRTSCGATERST